MSLLIIPLCCDNRLKAMNSICDTIIRMENALILEDIERRKVWKVRISKDTDIETVESNISQLLKAQNLEMMLTMEEYRPLEIGVGWTAL